jgi:hypothetical protein
LVHLFGFKGLYDLAHGRIAPVSQLAPLCA